MQVYGKTGYCKGRLQYRQRKKSSRIIFRAGRRSNFMGLVDQGITGPENSKEIGRRGYVPDELHTKTCHGIKQPL